jgi:hypothetical protein
VSRVVKIVGTERVKKNQVLQKHQAGDAAKAAAQASLAQPRIQEEMVGPGGWRVWTDGITVRCCFWRVYSVCG